MLVLILLTTSMVTLARVISIEDFGAIASNKAASSTNANAISATLAAARVGDQVLVPPAREYWALGGINASGLNGVTLRIAGILRADPDFIAWPKDPPNSTSCLDFIRLVNCNNIQITGGGLIDGQGLPWWNRVIIGIKPQYSRPHLVTVCVHACFRGLYLRLPRHHRN